MTYDSDLEKARKLIKQIGLELQQDPKFGLNIIEPLKIQGVDELGDYAVMIRAKMMSVPGEQFVIRRKVYAMIKKVFDKKAQNRFLYWLLQLPRRQHFGFQIGQI